MSDRDPAINDEPFSIPLSVVILAKNEESNIVRCVESVKWAADVVVIDDGSTDHTAEFANASGARVVQHAFESFASQRNWAMDEGHAVHDWVLHLDADEVCTDALRESLQTVLQKTANETVAFCMCRKTMLNGQWLKYSDGFPVWIMRLVRNGRARFLDNGHGEIAVPEVDGELQKIKEPFLHYAFSKGITNWIERHNRYSTQEALLEHNTTFSLNWKNVFSSDKATRRSTLRGISRCCPADQQSVSSISTSSNWDFWMDVPAGRSAG